MRPVAFRAWNREEKHWVKPEELTSPDQITVRVTKVGFRFLTEKESDYDFMQFTGLLDKNGVEIYEGDIGIVENSDYDPSEGDDPMFIKRIVYSIDGFKAEKDNSYEDLYEYWTEGNKTEGLEIIGNIYETPNLLEV